MQTQEETERLAREAQMDVAWELLQSRVQANPSPEPPGSYIPPPPPPAFALAQYNPNVHPVRYLLVTHASKPDHAKVIAMDGRTKGPNWTLPNPVTNMLLEIVSTLGFEVSDLRDEN